MKARVVILAREAVEKLLAGGDIHAAAEQVAEYLFKQQPQEAPVDECAPALSTSCSVLTDIITQVSSANDDLQLENQSLRSHIQELGAAAERRAKEIASLEAQNKQLQSDVQTEKSARREQRYADGFQAGRIQGMECQRHVIQVQADNLNAIQQHVHNLEMMLQAADKLVGDKAARIECAVTVLEKEETQPANIRLARSILVGDRFGYACFTHKEKGGRYVLLGVSAGAGTAGNETRRVYRDVVTGNLYHRKCADFAERMVRQEQLA